MESLLFNLFDYQRFENNEKLSSLISETGSRNAVRTGRGFRVLSDEELEMAAGGVGTTEFYDTDNNGSPGTFGDNDSLLINRKRQG